MLVRKVLIGLLLQLLSLKPIAYILIRLTFTRLVVIGAMQVTPSVVLLDNHTTTRIGSEVEED